MFPVLLVNYRTELVKKHEHQLPHKCLCDSHVMTTEEKKSQIQAGLSSPFSCLTLLKAEMINVCHCSAFLNKSS